MNNFYSIKGISDCLEHRYQLKNLRDTRQGMSTGVYGRDSFSGRDIKWSDSSSIKINSRDYDNLFVQTLMNINPPYDIEKFLDYHFKYFINKEEGEAEMFLKQIKYVVLPIVQKRKNNEVYLELINKWLEEKGMNFNNKSKNNMTIIKIGDVNAPMQIQQNVNGSQQTQQINYSKENITELFSLLRKDIEKLNTDLSDEFKTEMDYAIKLLNKDKDIKSPLLNIGSLIKSVGVSVFSNIFSSPIIEIIKPWLGL